ncbi:pyruvate dehydrogenase phosphatase regulatory subunit, mitochondrial-like isoform X1 [Haliotis rubra]|uniref:pyruvate dehydrogenase phosphatase regulatory subunit, mitochondrial-like isoform X1 n=1 Tax=Haliotis rubra TaxID=36100 RepID=UPI001EE60FEB|nr:pyruvate dehydrogenase phosphatase regulatory subunit, mitochondrial-like isoform X1 [Haliotis rubra]
MLNINMFKGALSRCYSLTRTWVPIPTNRNRSVECCMRQYRGLSSGTLDRRTYSTGVSSLPQQARVVVCGGGVVGSSIAYHLAERGVTDVVLLEQGSLTCGTTWHSAGLIGCIRAGLTEMKLTNYSRSLYRRLEEEGHGLGWKQCGSISLARTKDRMTDLRRKQAISRYGGVESHIVSPSEIADINPLVRHDDLAGGLYVPEDGVTTAPDVAMALSRLAKQKGVKVIEGVQLDKILTKNDRVYAVETSLGTINCEYFVNCGGQWAHEIGKKSSPEVKVPLHSCEHFYIVTKPIEGVPRNMPVIRDSDGYTYFREWNGGVLAGGFEPVAKPVFTHGIPDKFEFQLLPEDWDHFQVLLDEIMLRMHCFETAEVRQLINGPESFTPDNNWILGESPEVANYFVAAGMNSRGIAGAGGVGKYLTEWILDGEPSIDLWAHDVRRFAGLHNNKRFLRDRVKEVLGATFTLNYPQQSEFKTGRRLRTSPLHTRLEVAGGYFGETMAYERAVWFDRLGQDEDIDSDTISHRGTFGKPTWFDSVQDEYWACKERVCLIDMSSFAKFVIKSAGGEAVDFLQYLCSNDIDQDIGSIVHTGMQNERGGFENDCSIVRMEENSFFMICPSTQQTRALAWLRRHLPPDGSVQVEDVTSMYSGINMIGPHAQHLLADVSDTPTDKNEFKAMTSKVIDVGYASGIIAMRLTHSGEDGFILYIPSDYANHTYDTLMQSGVDYGVRNAGYYAMRHLRMEKFFAYWGLDLNALTTPMECGREFRVKLEKGDFIGREALKEQKENGIKKKFVQFLLEDFDVNRDLWPWGGEPVYRNGVFAGVTTTCGYGFTLDRMVCLGYVSDFDDDGNPKLKKNMNKFVMEKDAHYQIDIGGKRYSAKAGIYTPKLAMSTVEPSSIPVPE